MDFNTMISSNWNELKGQVRQKWGKLSDQDTETWKGNYEEFSGKVQRAYGLTKDKVEEEFRSMLSKFSDHAQVKADDAKAGLDRYNHNIKETKVG